MHFCAEGKKKNNPMKHTKKNQITLDDYIKAVKKGNREAEQELLGPGFHATHRVHKSKFC